MDKQTREEKIEKLGELIDGIEIAMLTTVEADQSLRSRPMATLKRKFDGELYFFTSASSSKADEVERDQNVNVSYADPNDNKYVSISGTARLLRDRQKMAELWTPVLKVWFPQGLDDPDLALLRVTVERAEYWDSPANRVSKVFAFARAFITGNTESLGENERLDF